MICFRISIFEPLKTTEDKKQAQKAGLWFAFELVSLNHWKQQIWSMEPNSPVVICFRISIFEPLKTTVTPTITEEKLLWFAFELVSLNHWKQLADKLQSAEFVVICFRISIFEPLKTTHHPAQRYGEQLWFAFELVSLNHWKQLFYNS